MMASSPFATLSLSTQASSSPDTNVVTAIKATSALHPRDSVARLARVGAFGRSGAIRLESMSVNLPQATAVVSLH